MPELIVINKADAADPMVITRLLAREPHAVVVSARTGEGIDELLPPSRQTCRGPRVEVDVLLPYARGDLLNRMHEQGEVLRSSTWAEGRRVSAGQPESRGRARATYSPVSGADRP